MRYSGTCITFLPLNFTGTIHMLSHLLKIRGHAVRMWGLKYSQQAVACRLVFQLKRRDLHYCGTCLYLQSQYTVFYTSELKHLFLRFISLLRTCLSSRKVICNIPSFIPSTGFEFANSAKKKKKKQEQNPSQNSRNHKQTKHAVYEWCVGSFTSHWVVWTVRSCVTGPMV